MKARRLPGVRCSTLKTECRSLLCLMIMPGRSWVAGIAIAGTISFLMAAGWRTRAGHFFHQTQGSKALFYTHLGQEENRTRPALSLSAISALEATRMTSDSSKNRNFHLRGVFMRVGK